MPDFTYAAIDHGGKTIRGHLEEADQVRAIERVKEMGLFPTQILPRARHPAALRSRTHLFENRPDAQQWWGRHTLNQRDLADFTGEGPWVIHPGSAF